VTVTVTATFVVSASARARFLAAARAVIPPTRAEAGCVTYVVHEDAEQPGVFMFYEVWRSAEDLAAHLATAHVGSFLRSVEPLLDGEIDVRSWQLPPETQ
jgi:quinol monooxygenase YgiN